MVISSTERRSCLEEKHNRRRRRWRRERGEEEDEEEKEIPMSTSTASVSCHLLLPPPPSLSPYSVTTRLGATEGGHKLKEKVSLTQTRERIHESWITHMLVFSTFETSFCLLDAAVCVYVHNTYIYIHTVYMCVCLSVCVKTARL